MRIFITLLFCATCISATAQKPDNRIVIGTVDTVFSKILNEKRALLIHVPNGGKDERTQCCIYWMAMIISIQQQV